MPIQFPFRYITGLPPRAQEEIWRDLQAIGDGVQGTKVYDAYVDPLATADNPAGRVFTTIFAAVKYVGDTLGQTWVNIGIFVPKAGSNPLNITETGNYGGTNTVYVQIDAVGAALGGEDADFGGNQHTAVNWELSSFTDSSKFGRIQLRGLFVNSNIAAPGGPFTNASLELLADRCYFNLNGHARLTPGNTTGRVFMTHCVLQAPSLAGMARGAFDNCFLSGTLATEIWAGGLFFRDCRFSNMGNSQYTDATHSLIISGCSFTQYSSGAAVTSGQLTVNSAVFCFIDSVGEEGSQNQGLTLITANDLVLNLWVEGRYWSMVIGRPPAASSLVGSVDSHHIHAQVENGFDVTGPANIALQSYGNAPGACFLRGEALVGSAMVAANSFSGTALSIVGVKDSVLLLVFQAYSTVGTGKAYSIDAASVHNTIITAGAQLLPTSSTNSSTTTIVINETAVFPVDLRDFQHEWMSELATGVTTFPVPASTAGVDLRDFQHEWMSELVTGVTVIPAALPGSAPTGPAGGALTSTYPNPNFAGRNATADKMDQDMLAWIALLNEGVTYFPALTLAETAADIDARRKDLVPTLLGP